MFPQNGSSSQLKLTTPPKKRKEDEARDLRIVLQLHSKSASLLPNMCSRVVLNLCLQVYH